MPKKRGPGGGSPAKPLTRPCCGKTANWRLLWNGKLKFPHNPPCRGKRAKRIKYHAINLTGLEMELDA